MKTLLDPPFSTTCAEKVEQLTLLSKDSLVQKKRTFVNATFFVALMMALIAMVAIWSGLYPLMLLTVSLLPLLLDSIHRHNVIAQQLNRQLEA